MSTKAQARKSQIISGLVETRRGILSVASSLPLGRQDEVFLGIWSAKDLLAHLLGWDLTNITAAQEILAGKLPSFYSHHDRDWKTYNARLVAEHHREDLADLIASVEDSLQELIGFLETIPAEEFDKDRGIRFRRYKVTIARLLQAEIDDEKTHHMQISEFAERNNQLLGERSEPNL